MLISLLLPMLVFVAAPPTRSGLEFSVSGCLAEKHATAHLEIYAHGTTNQSRDTLVSIAVPYDKGKNIFLPLTQGGYQLSIYSGRCSAQASFGILDDHVRSYRISLHSTVAPEQGEDNDIPAIFGMVAGTLSSADVCLRGKAYGTERVFRPQVEKNAYYFDNVPSGKYELIVSDRMHKSSIEVNVPTSFKLLRVNL